MILVYLGLAIAGWGGFDAFFQTRRAPAVIATAAVGGAALFSSPI